MSSRRLRFLGFLLYFLSFLLKNVSSVGQTARSYNLTHFLTLYHLLARFKSLRYLFIIVYKRPPSTGHFQEICIKTTKDYKQINWPLMNTLLTLSTNVAQRLMDESNIDLVLFCVLGCFVYVSIEIYRSIATYRLHLTTTEINKINSEEIHFPSVTFCNFNR